MYQDETKQQNPTTLFLLLFSPFTKILRFSGLFPASNSWRHFSNFYHYIIVAMLLLLNFYFITYKVITVLLRLFSSITATDCVLLGVFVWFYRAFLCVSFVARTGHNTFLKQLNDLLFEATKQKALESKFEVIRQRMLISAAFLCPAIASFTAFIPVIAFTEFGSTWPAAESLKSLLFYDFWYLNVFVAIILFYNALACGTWILFYVFLCQCLKEEFISVSEEIKKMDIRDKEPFKRIALTHSRLLKCLDFLYKYLSFYMFVSFAVLTVLSIIFAYVVMTDVAMSFRILAGFWLMTNVPLAFTFCNSAESLCESVSYH